MRESTPFTPSTLKYLWITLLLALGGVFSVLLPLAITPNIALVANAVILILFIVSLERFAAYLLPHPRGNPSEGSN